MLHTASSFQMSKNRGRWRGIHGKLLLGQMKSVGGWGVVMFAPPRHQCHSDGGCTNVAPAQNEPRTMPQVLYEATGQLEITLYGSRSGSTAGQKLDAMKQYLDVLDDLFRTGDQSKINLARESYLAQRNDIINATNIILPDLENLDPEACKTFALVNELATNTGHVALPQPQPSSLNSHKRLNRPGYTPELMFYVPDHVTLNISYNHFNSMFLGRLRVATPVSVSGGPPRLDHNIKIL